MLSNRPAKHPSAIVFFIKILVAPNMYLYQQPLVCMCVCVCGIYMHMCACMCVYVHPHARVCVSVCVHMFVCAMPPPHPFPSIPAVFHPVECSYCHSESMMGFRYRCQQCHNYQLCQDCFWRGHANGSHSNQHQMKEYTSWVSGVGGGHDSIRPASQCSSHFCFASPNAVL